MARGKMPSVSPCERTMRALRKTWDLVAKVEKWINTPSKRRCPTCHQGLPPDKGPPGRRIDLYGVADIEALNRDATLYAQACPQSRFGDHLAKLLTSEGSHRILDAYPLRRLELWGWRQLVDYRAKGGKRWAPNVREILPGDLQPIIKRKGKGAGQLQIWYNKSEGRTP
jgi:hypothetical protein